MAPQSIPSRVTLGGYRFVPAVPRTLRYLFRDDSGKLRSRSTVKIVTLGLRPPLTVRDFDRS